MERKKSECKINNFIQKLPPPSVAIERWKSHDGVNKSVYEAYAPKPRHMNEDEERDLDYEKDPFVMNPDLLLQELDECRWLPQEGCNSFGPTHYGSSHV